MDYSGKIIICRIEYMPYRKNYNKGYKKTYRKKPYVNKRTDKTQTMMGKTINYGLRYAKNIPGPVGLLARGMETIKNLINVETKYIDVNYGGQVTDITVLPTYVVPLNDLAEGDDYNQRNGRSVLNESLTVNWSAFKVNGNNDTQNFIRVILASDKKADVSGAYIQDILGSSATYLSQIDKQLNGDRFVILRSFVICLTNMEPAQTGKIFINLKGTHTLFDSTTADVEKNSIRLFALSDQPAQAPQLVISSRFRYTDN